MKYKCLSNSDIVQIRERIAAGEKESTLAKNYGVSRQYINLIKLNQARPGLGPDVSKRSRETHRAEIEKLVSQIRQLAEEGKNNREICEKLGLDVGYLNGLRQRFQIKVKRSPHRSKGKPTGIRPGAKITKEDAIAIRVLRKRGVSVKFMEHVFGLKNPAIYHILNGRTWKDV